MEFLLNMTQNERILIILSDEEALQEDKILFQGLYISFIGQRN